MLSRNQVSFGVVTIMGCCLFWMTSEITCCKVSAQEKTNDSAADSKEDDSQEDWDKEKAFKEFQELLSGSKLVGNFTVVGTKKDLSPEEYHIEKVTKAKEGDYWNFKVRIKYGKYDLNVVFPLQVKWAGDTPIITVQGDNIPGFGKFNARVVIHENKYSGTWSHGETGGHLFGTIEKGKADMKSKADAKSKKTEKQDK
jgi:hypothetical protein